MEIETTLKDKKTARLIMFASYRPRRLVLNHLQKTDYAGHTAVVLHMKQAITHKHFADLYDEGLIEPLVSKKKRVNFVPNKRGGCRGTGQTLYIISEMGRAILDYLAVPAPISPPIRREERKPFEPI